MSKFKENRVLITSDQHIGDYPKRNPFKDFRLNQTYIMADNVCEIGNQYHCNSIFMLGDLLELRDKDSTIHYVAKYYLNKISENFDICKIIFGNHDLGMKSASQESPENDRLTSYIDLYCPNKFIYSDRQVVEIAGTTIAFRNFSRATELDLDFIKEQGYSQVDILCGHSSQMYETVETNIDYGIQKYDESLVKYWSFFGHIHQSKSLGKNVSVGVPQRCKIKDDKPTFVILDLDTKTWEYVDADPHGKLMKLEESTEHDTDYYDSSTNTYYISRKNPEINKELINSISGSNYNEIFEKEIISKGLQNCYEEIKSITPQEKLEKLDLDFKIESISISNWRSIESFNMTFTDPDPQYLVTGPNGNGKSSLFSAIIYCLTGELTRGIDSDNIRIGQESFCIELNLTYKSDSYFLKRSVSKKKGTSSIVELWKNGEKLELGGVRDTKNKIKEYLPFAEAINLFYYNKENSNILGGGSKEDTKNLQLLYKILGLNEIDAYNETAIIHYKTLDQNIKNLDQDIKIKEGILGDKKNKMISLENLYGISGQTNLKDLYTATETELSEKSNLYQEFRKNEEQKKMNQTLEFNISRNESQLIEFKSNLKSYKSYDDYTREIQVIDSEIYNLQIEIENINSYKSEITKLETSLEYIKKEGNSLKQLYQEKEKEINTPTECPYLCKTCSLITPEIKRTKLSGALEELINKINLKYSEYKETESKLNLLKSKPQDSKELNNKLQELNIKKINLITENNNLKNLENNIKILENTIESQKKQRIGIEIKEIILPENILEIISELTTRLTNLRQYKLLAEEFEKARHEYEIKNREFLEQQDKLKKLQDFIELSNPGGPVYKKIFEIIMEKFSDSIVRYSVERARSNTKNLISINAYLKKGQGKEISYSNASTGEKTLIDIHFLDHLKVKFGLLILDEFLANLDPENHNDSIDRLKNLNSNLLFVSSHLENISNFPHRITCTKTNDITEYKYD